MDTAHHVDGNHTLIPFSNVADITGVYTGPMWTPLVTADYTVGVLLSLCTFVGLLGNSVALRYFAKKRKEVSTFIYLLIVSVDITNSLLMFSPSVSYFISREPFLLQYSFFCNLWGVLFSITSRLSVFLVAVLSISRTVSLRLPFRRVRKRHVLTPLLFYFLVLLGTAMLPFYYGNRYTYDPVSVLCLWSLIGDIHPNSIGFFMLYIFYVNVPFILPFFPIVISCLISINELRKNTAIHSQLHEQGTLQDRKQYASRTIVLITCIYIICNFPVCIYCIIEVVSFVLFYKYHFPRDYIMSDHMNMTYLRLLLAVYCVGINAAINPFVYLCRIKAFKAYSDKLTFKMKKTVVRRSQKAHDKSPIRAAVVKLRSGGYLDIETQSSRGESTHV